MDTSQDLERARCIEQVTSLLVQRKYQEIEWLSRGIRMDAKTLERAIADYGRTLVEPPAPAGADWVSITNSSPPAWSVNVPLFTAEEGHSDLTLTLTLRQSDSGRYQIEVDDLHVL